MILVVGLGNPGPRYAGSLHNLGFRVLDALADDLNVAGWASRFQAAFAAASIEGRDLALLKPQTFMNRSGDSVLAAAQSLKVPAESVVVVHDELDLPRGRVKLKRGGGEAGHNGLRSVSAKLASQQYLRLRVGVDRPSAGDVVDYLLAPLDPDAARDLEPSVALSVAALRRLATEGSERCMGWLNVRRDASQAGSPGGPEGAAAAPDVGVATGSPEVSTKLEKEAKDRL